ncbi:MAG: hypothetical protein Q9207_003600 [Kuettlingeria erythrocarpa]
MASRVPITDVAKAIDCLEEDGGVILTGFATVGEVTTVNEDAAPYLDAVAREVAPEQKRASNGQPRGTVRCHRLFGRSQTAREKWLQGREVHQILNHFLQTRSIPYNDQAGCVIETNPILSAATTMQISPGEKAQDLHRDDFIWQRTHIRSEAGNYERGWDDGMGMIVAGSATTVANGATVENQFLWWTKEEVEAWSKAAQKQAGYLLGNPFIGHCDDSDPLPLFRASETPAKRRAG